jgi:hypothetical protein
VKLRRGDSRAYKKTAITKQPVKTSYSPISRPTGIGLIKLTSTAADISIEAPNFVPSFRKDLQPANNSSVARTYGWEFQYSQEALKIIEYKGKPLHYRNGKMINDIYVEIF